jgi:hypothetical protein
MNSVRDGVQTLNIKHVAIVWGGSNGISKNNTKVAINQLCKFAEGKSELPDYPHSHPDYPHSHSPYQLHTCKMAEDVVEIEIALNLVVTTTDQSINMRKTLKEKIYQTVRTLRQSFSKITISGEQKLSEINLTKKISTLEAELLSYKEQHNKRQQAPSIDSNDEQEEQRHIERHLPV